MRAVDRSAPARRQHRHSEFRSRLLCVVEDMLASGESYAELTVEQIAAAAGTSRSNFYAHFRDKGHLLEEFVVDVILVLARPTRLWWSLPGDTGYDELRESIGVVFDDFRERRDLMAAVTDAAGYDAGVKRALEDLMLQAQTSLADHISVGQADGSMRRGVEPNALAGWIIWAAERGLVKLFGGVSPQEADELCDAFTHIIWFSIHSASTPRPPIVK